MCDKYDERLFQIGWNDVEICKENFKSTIFQNDFCSFDYHGIENALIGKIFPFSFYPKRILVIQMVNEREIKIDMSINPFIDYDDLSE